MHFLGRSQTEPDSGAAAEGNMDKGGTERECVASNQIVGHRPNPYAGVIVFCIPMVTEIGRDAINTNSFQVWILGYVVLNCIKLLYRVWRLTRW